MRETRFHPICLFSVLALVTAVAPIHSARASADIDCDADVKLRHIAFSRCNNMSAMSPGNDTRTNLLLLLADRDAHTQKVAAPVTPLAPDAIPLLFWPEMREQFDTASTDKADTSRGSGFPNGEGSRCLSNQDGAAAFETALNAAAGVPPEDRDALVKARKTYKATCAPAQAGNLPDVHSPQGQAFASYLQGTQAFYDGRFDAALEAFSKLHGNANAWLADTADYMVARTELNRLQLHAFDEYGEFGGSDKIDQTAAAHTLASFDAYVHDHPTGTYAVSAIGLVRRIHWLTGHTAALAATYTKLIAGPTDERGLDDATLAEEIGAKLLPKLKPEMTRDPILLAAYDLMTMRQPDAPPKDSAPAAPPPLDLEAQRAAFASAPLLFDYLVATQALYIDNDPAKVMQLVPDDTHRRDGDHLWFSRQVLRGLALEAKGDRNTRGFWKELGASATRPLDHLTVELALAMHDERAGTLDDIFAKGSIVTSQSLRQTLLDNSADAALLRRQAKNLDTSEKERRTALATLLWKEVSRGRTGDFVADVALVPADVTSKEPNAAPAPASVFAKPAPGDIGCPLLRETASQLADDPRNVRARLCLAEFVRVNDMDGNALDRQPSADVLGGSPSQFPGKAYARGDTYKAVIADKGASGTDKAFALYRAIKCYEPSNVNGCGGDDVPKARRKAWYFSLKRTYPASRWAQELTYWW